MHVKLLPLLFHDVYNKLNKNIFREGKYSSPFIFSKHLTLPFNDMGMRSVFSYRVFTLFLRSFRKFKIQPYFDGHYFKMMLF